MRSRFVYILTSITLLFFLSCTGIEIESIQNDDYLNDDKDQYNENNIENNEDQTDNSSEDINNNENIDEEVNEIPSNDDNNENDITSNKEENQEALKENEYDNEKENEISDEKKLSSDFEKYFNKKVYEISLYPGKSYDKSNLVQVFKESDFYMTFPNDIKDYSKDEDWNLLWEGKYNNDITEEDEDNERDKISVRFITIDREIPEGKSNNYINDLFFGFLSTESFHKLGINKWKPYIDENLKKILNDKGIISSFVYSGITHIPQDKTSLVNYFVFIFFNREKNKLVFLTCIFSFNKYAFARMERDGIIDAYYKNWISFISTFNFL
jgi:hypothetical protein